jgi:hypothetical protein
VAKSPTRYADILTGIFHRHYRPGATSFSFRREEIEEIAAERDVRLPKNLGDLVYSFRYRATLPAAISATAPDGFEWSIEGGGRAVYHFKLVRTNRIVPSENREVVKIPDATPRSWRSTPRATNKHCWPSFATTA